MNCPKCQASLAAQLEVGGNHCGQCGYLFGRCPRCTAFVRDEFADGERACRKCGTDLSVVTDETAGPNLTHDRAQAASVDDHELWILSGLVLPAAIAGLSNAVGLGLLAAAAFVGSLLGGFISAFHFSQLASKSVQAYVFLLALPVFTAASFLFCFLSVR